MYCWGSTVHGELGLGGVDDENILTPQEVQFQKASEIRQIACGENYTVLVTQDGELYSCGNNDYGQLGHNEGRKRIQKISGWNLFVFRAIACGASHTIALDELGHLFSWGCNIDGQLGSNSTDVGEHRSYVIGALSTRVVVQVACGIKHVLALTNNGELYAWGSNEYGQLGLGPGMRKQTEPKLVQSLAAVPIAFISCGGYHSVVITKSGAVFAWGKNVFGQLGLNDTQERNLPCQLRTLRNAKLCYAACGEDFTVFLTLDGGVFTCGAGMYGQLGHGNNSNEILPRQVMELMGTTITQISCGRRHTLALDPSQGRIYAWGMGGAGQLGNRTGRSVATPQIVQGPWVSPNDTSRIISSAGVNTTDCVVKRIFCGVCGNHCFATVSPKKDNIRPDDCRTLDPLTQIITVTEEQLADCAKLKSGSRVHGTIMSYLETVFMSQACINGSFLLGDDAHFNCSSKHHGVDLVRATRIFGIISDIDNVTVQRRILSCITESLLPSLVSSPPDVESLRIYLTLPLYHGFLNPTNCAALHMPFCRAILSLKAEALKVVKSWWAKSPEHYYGRLIRTHKFVVLHFIRQANPNRSVAWDISLLLALRFLRLLYDLNKSADEGIITPYETFYLPELINYIDISSDYLEWLNESDLNQKRRIYFCDYPFLLDVQGKSILLETDQAIQMHCAMSDAAMRYLGNNIDPREFQFIRFNVSRENIVYDTLKELSRYHSSDLKRPLTVKFRGEEGEDAGGVRKEFFLLLLREILDPKYGMFKQYEETNTIWFSEDSFEDKHMYTLIGTLCGLVIYNFIIIDLPFPLALYKKLLGEPVGLVDIKDMSPVLARSMQDILEYNEPDFEEVFCMNFEILRDVFGEQRIVELIPGGSSIPVTLENKKRFVDLYADYILNKSVRGPYEAFSEGFHNVMVGGRVLQLFHSHELMAVVVGNENYDWEELEKNAIYEGGYTKDDPTIVMFWNVFHGLTQEEKKQFLFFLTGSDRIPIQGMKALKIKIQPMPDERFLPVAHTCFNLMDLPRYQTRERLRYKLLQAIQQTEGFSLV